ncbi:MAG: hypothetical protein AAFZ18_06300 [Myxococcota bacterium]
MKDRRPLLGLSASLLFLLTACGGGGVSGLCDKLDDCNSLNGSVNECVETNEAILNNLPSSQKSDCERAIDACNELESCGNFVTCVGNLPC